MKKRLIAKTEEELLVQDKKIKEYIARKGFSSNEQIDINAVAVIKYDIKLFFQGLPSVGVLPVDFALGSSSITSFF